MRSLVSLNPWWQSAPFDTGVPRAIVPRLVRWLQRDLPVAVIGMRRVGKTTALRQAVSTLLSQGVPARDILFVNLEDAVFVGQHDKPTFLDDLFDLYRERVNPTGMPWVFLDEVQVVEHWARWVRMTGETGRARVAISGSNSKLLEPELASVLTGRVITMKLQGFSFREFLVASGELPESSNLELADRAMMRRNLRRYMEGGGLPRAVMEPDELSAGEVLRQYFRDILYRDIVARHGVRNVRRLEQVAFHLLEMTARSFTYNRLKNLHDMPVEQARSYVAYLRDSHMLHTVSRLAYKPGERTRAARKVYANDVGLRNAVCFRFSQDLGWLAETLVHSQLALRRGAELYYFAERAECDFVVWHERRAIEAVQVCFGASPLPDRELRGLVTAMDALGLAQGTIVTEADSELLVQDGRRVRLVPLWRWLLEEDQAGERDRATFAR